MIFLQEELSTHNKGRDGYLNKVDFLQRTDLRQFEKEKNMRTTQRKWIKKMLYILFSLIVATQVNKQ